MIDDLDLGDLALDFGADGLDLSAFANPDDPLSGSRYILPPRPKRVSSSLVRYDRAADLARELGPSIADGATVHALLSGNFIFGDFFEALCVETGATIDDLTLSTLSFGDENVVSFANLMAAGALGSLNIVVSDYFWSHNRHNASFIYGELDKGDRFQLAVAGVHTKIALLRVGRRRIVMHGSANLRSSRCVETLTIETSPDLYDFHLAWHRALLDRYATIRKAIREPIAFAVATGAAA